MERMSIGAVKDILTEAGTRMLHLSDELEEHGRPLTRDQKDEIRTALSMVWFPGAIDEARFFFASGKLEDLSHTIKGIEEVAEQFS